MDLCGDPVTSLGFQASFLMSLYRQQKAGTMRPNEKTENGLH